MYSRGESEDSTVDSDERTLGSADSGRCAEERADAEMGTCEFQEGWNEPEKDSEKDCRLQDLLACQRR